jgi:ribosomal protein S18 acetylase RimI-like enzyme
LPVPTVWALLSDRFEGAADGGWRPRAEERNRMGNIITSAGTEIRDTVTADIEAIQKVCDACAYIDQWADRQNIPDQTIGEQFKKSITEFNHDTGIVRLYTVLRQQEVIGYLKLLYSYPDAGSVWIAAFEIDPPFQHQGIGGEIIQALLSHLSAEKKFKRVFLAVDIKNWPALGFWIKQGFDKIERMYGDKVYAADAFSSLVLSREPTR